nr:hypothetical protein [Tanacetum cinerariifolium]
MATTIEQQVALDKALVPSTKRIRIGRSNFRLPSDIQSKEPTLQVVYDVLRGCPFFKAFLIIADVPAIYMQEFKMDSKKNIVDLEAFREMLHISPRIPCQSFDELPFEEEILDFLRFLGHSAQIKTLTDNQKKSNEMYYPRFTKVIIHHFMTKKPSIPRRNKVNWHYVRDDMLFSTIKVVSRHQNTQQYGAILPIELTTEDIRNTKAYIEYYAYATGEAAPKPKASAKRKRGGSDSSTTPPTVVASPRPITTVVASLRLTAAAKGKQPARATSPYDPLEHGGSSTDEGTGSKPGVSGVPSDDSEEEISWNSFDDEDVDAQVKGRHDDEGKKNDESDDGKDDDDDDQDDAERDDDDDDDGDEEEIAKLDEQKDTESGEGDAEETKSYEESAKEETREEKEESFDPIPKTPEDSGDDGNGKEDQGLRVSEEQRLIEEEKADELYHEQESSSVSSFVTSMLNPISDAGVESIFMTASSPIAPLQTSIPIMTPSTIATITTSSDATIPPTTIPSAVLQNLPTFDSVFRFEDRVKSLEVNFSEFMQTNQFAEAVSNIPGIVHQYMNQKMMEAVQEAVQIQIDRLQDSFQRENNEFLHTIDENMKRIIKGHVKIAADLTEMELKKILIKKMEGNKDDVGMMMIRKDPPLDQTGGQRDEEKNKTLPTVQGSAQTWISELAKQDDSRSSFNELLDTPIDFSNFIMNRLCIDILTLKLLAGPTYELMRGSCTSLTELEYHRLVIPFAHFINNDLEYLRGGASSQKYTTSMTKTKAADYGHIKWIEDLVPRTMWIQEPLNYDKYALWGVSHWRRKRQQFYGFAINRESALDVYSKRRIIAVTDLKIVEWHNYKHLDWISVRRDDDKIYKFKEGDFNRLRLQDIEDMLLLLV